VTEEEGVSTRRAAEDAEGGGESGNEEPPTAIGNGGEEPPLWRAVPPGAVPPGEEVRSLMLAVRSDAERAGRFMSSGLRGAKGL
jgi:hypothetical protein